MLAWMPAYFQGLHRPAHRLQSQHTSLDASLFPGPFPACFQGLSPPSSPALEPKSYPGYQTASRTYTAQLLDSRTDMLAWVPIVSRVYTGLKTIACFAAP
ncbi:hypothetical protein Bbelb_008320 [Branchiostoma belcheri]|nr:hypothetical protein Bbelb_008320 [Branchiostoma belcheri]